MYLRLAAALLALGVPWAAAPAEGEDAVSEPHFREGEQIPFSQIERLRDYLPPEFWEYREYFFYEGMDIVIGPERAYPASPTYDAATQRNGRASIGRDSSLAGYVSGQPFDPAQIDCTGDPEAAAKIIWNFKKGWNGSGGRARWWYSYWDRGDQLPLYYKGEGQWVQLAQRTEEEFAEQGGVLFKGEKRIRAGGVYVEAPFDARGIITMNYDYLAEDGPLDQTRDPDLWVYIPDLRRVRRISAAQRTDSIAGTDFTIDDLRSFNGRPPQYNWTCLREARVIAPMNTLHLAYPYTESYNFGPFGFSFANDRWELRNAWVIRFVPKADDHPYSRKDIYVDRETFEPLYSFAYDRKKELWKIIWHNHRFSEDWNGTDPLGPEGVWYPVWPGVDRVSDLRVVADIIVNVQTGTGNRIEFWNSVGTPETQRGKIRKIVDLGRLNRGR